MTANRWPRSGCSPSRRSASWVAIFGIATALLSIALAAPATLPGHPSTGLPRRGSALARPDAVPLQTGGLGSLFLTIYNPSSNATGTFEQIVRLDSALYAELINANWTNGEAFYVSNGTPVNMWIESGASNQSANTILWLRLYSIGPGLEAQVALHFSAKSAFLLNSSGFSGENPQLSAAYGAFDNGARVFDFYDNFAGTSLKSAWTVSGSWSYTVHNGIGITSIPGSGGYISTTATFAYPEAVDFYGDLFQSVSASAFMNEGIGTSSCSSCGNAATAGFDSGGSVLTGPTPALGVGSSFVWSSTAAFTTQQYGVFTTAIGTGEIPTFELNYSELPPPGGSAMSGPQPVGLAMSGNPSGSTTNTETTYWIRERNAAPAVVASVTPVVSGTTPLAALPGTVPVRSSLTVIAFPGTWPAQSYAYLGLPPGCTSVDLPVLSCVVTQTGVFAPSVTISDGVGDTLVGITNVTVVQSTAAPLSVSLAAVPPSVPVNGSVTVIASPAGGAPPYTFRYDGLPAGCTSTDAPFLTCSPLVAGPYVIGVNLTDANAETAQSAVSLTVTGSSGGVSPKLQASLTAFSGPIPTGTTLDLVASVVGGEPPYSFAYSGLPAGCTSANTSAISCVPTAEGAYLLQVTVTDAEHQQVSATTNLTLTAPSSSGTGGSSGPSDPLLYGVLAGVAIAIVLAALALVRSLRSGRPPSS